MTARLHWFPDNFHISNLAATLSGMANSDGGVIVLGISPRRGEVHGVSNLTDTFDSVFQAELMLEPPLVLPLPHGVKFGSKQVVVIQVPPGLPNVYSLHGQYWERKGTQTQLIPPRQLRTLLLDRTEIQFDRRVAVGARYEDLDPKQISDYLEAVTSSNELQWDKPIKEDMKAQFLLQRGCLQRMEGRLTPTYAGLLLFCETPQQWLPSAVILAARFPGKKFSDDYIKQEIRGSLPQQLRQAETFLRSNLRTTVHMNGLSHREVLEYPFEAVRELLVNAVVHRDYNAQGDTIHLQLFNDRLEVHSPGGLPGPVNLENLLQARFARNPVITQLMADLGFVERLGYGLDRVVSTMQEMHLPPPKFDETAGSFIVTLKNNYHPQQNIDPVPDFVLSPNATLNPRQEIAIGYLIKNRRISNKDLQELCPDVHMETLRRDFADLVSQGILIKIGDKRATYYILKEKQTRKQQR